MIARLPIHILALLVGLILVACATGPVQTARAYQDAIAARQPGAIARLSEGDGLANQEWMEQALAAGAFGPLPDDSQWNTQQVTAKVEAGDAVYLLAKHGDEWKVRCASIGPYHDYTPEMTLLLAVHLIKSSKFNELRELLPSTLELTGAEFPAAFQDELRRWASWMSMAACRPFAINYGRAELLYSAEGGRKRVVLVLERNHWKIEALW
jgi:hypothetical protein